MKKNHIFKKYFFHIYLRKIKKCAEFMEQLVGQTKNLASLQTVVILLDKLTFREIPYRYRGRWCHAFEHVETYWSSENPRNWAGFCALTVSCRCGKSHLWGSKRSENIINRKTENVYMEAVPQKISTPKCFTKKSTKKSEKKMKIKNRKFQNFENRNLKNRKFEIFDFEIFDFQKFPRLIFC